MSKWIKCTVTAVKILLVECEDDDSQPKLTAANIAGNEAFDGTFDEITSTEVCADDLESERRHADAIIRIEEPS